MKKLTLILCLGFLLTGCSGDKPAVNSTTSTTETGVPACDEYLAKAEKFVNNPNIPETPATPAASGSAQVCRFSFAGAGNVERAGGA